MAARGYFRRFPTNEERAEPGARANDHRRHASCSEQHESRRRRSWLILNVRRFLFGKLRYLSQWTSFRCERQPQEYLSKESPECPRFTSAKDSRCSREKKKT